MQLAWQWDSLSDHELINTFFPPLRINKPLPLTLAIINPFLPQINNPPPLWTYSLSLGLCSRMRGLCLCCDPKPIQIRSKKIQKTIQKYSKMIQKQKPTQNDACLSSFCSHILCRTTCNITFKQGGVTAFCAVPQFGIYMKEETQDIDAT